MDQGLGASAIAQHLTNLGRKISQQAISKRMQRLREVDEERANYVLPWRVRTEHSRGHIYEMVVALGKHQKGQGVTPYQLELAGKLEKYLRDRGDAVMTYDRDAGFILRNRRPDDGQGALAA
jgi:hypothetical protein